MSIKNNTTSLQSLLDAVNSLPEVSGGIETCAVTINIFDGELKYLDETQTLQMRSSSESNEEIHIVKNSIVIFQGNCTVSSMIQPFL